MNVSVYYDDVSEEFHGTDLDITFRQGKVINSIEFVFENSGNNVIYVTSVGGQTQFLPDTNNRVTEPKMRLTLPPLPDTSSAILPWDGDGTCYGLDVEMAIPAVADQTSLSCFTTQPAIKNMRPSGEQVNWIPDVNYPISRDFKWFNNLRQQLDLWVTDFKIYRDPTTKESVIPTAAGSAVVTILD